MKKSFLVLLLLAVVMPVMASAQEVAETVAAAVGSEGGVLAALVTAVIPFATRYAYEGLQQALKFLKAQGELVKVLGAVLAGAGITWVTSWLGLPLPVDPGAWTEVTVLGLLEGLAAAGLHKLARK